MNERSGSDHRLQMNGGLLQSRGAVLFVAFLLFSGLLLAHEGGVRLLGSSAATVGPAHR